MIRPSVGLLGLALLWGWLVGMRLLPLRPRKLVILGLCSVLIALLVSSVVPHRGGIMTQIHAEFGSMALASCFFHLLVFALIRRWRGHADFDRNR